MKRLMISILSILFSLPQLSVYAANSVSEIEVNKGFKVSQYDALNQCFDNDNCKLAYQYHMHFLSSLPMHQLRQFNYDDEQIYAIKTFNGSKQMMQQSSPYIYVSAGNMVNDAYCHGVRFSWTWFGKPVLTGPSVNDGIVVSWRSYNSNDQEISSSLTTHKVKLRYGNKDVFRIAEPNNLDHVTYLLFNMNGPAESTSYGHSGYFDVTVSTNNKVEIKRTEFKFYYGHSNSVVNDVSFRFEDCFDIRVIDGAKMAEKKWSLGDD